MAQVLVVDDTEIVRAAVAQVVRRMGHTAVTAATGEDALEAVARSAPDLALLDLRMPGMDGAALYQALRSRLGARCPPVVIVSASPPDEVARRVGTVGLLAGIVRKPFALDELVRAIGEALAAGSPVVAAGA
jgi:two-component system, OmpR family, response regulator